MSGCEPGGPFTACRFHDKQNCPIMVAVSATDNESMERAGEGLKTRTPLSSAAPLLIALAPVRNVQTTSLLSLRTFIEDPASDHSLIKSKSITKMYSLMREQ